MNRTRTVPEMLENLWTRPPVRLLVYLLLLVLLFLAARRLASVLVMVGVAYGVAYLCNPLLARLEKRGLARTWGVLLLLLVFLAVVALLFWRLVTQVSSFVEGLPALADRLTALLDAALDRAGGGSLADELQYRLALYVQAKAQEISHNIGPILDQMLFSGPSLLGRLSGILGWLGQAGLVLTLALYFALDYERVGRGLLKVFPRDWQPTVERLSEDVSVSFGRFIRGQLLTGLGVGTLAGLGLLLLKVPNPLALGLLTAVLYLVPFVGMVLATIPPLLQAVPQGTTTLALVAGLYFILNQIGGNVLGPLVMGRTTQANPAALMVAVLIGLGLAGVWGALLAVPVALLLQRWTVRYWLPSRAYQGRIGQRDGGQRREEQRDRQDA
ncbi:putative transport protein Rv0205 [Deinococcus carri]|uniref:Transport protein Rv0205 n=1 Tax=Deinococcus carri TaxID=1211323 RepID=A0ABP9W5W1_9DEIO